LAYEFEKEKKTLRWHEESIKNLGQLSKSLDLGVPLQTPDFKSPVTIEDATGKTFQGEGLEVGVEYEGSSSISVVAKFPLGTDWVLRSSNYIDGKWVKPVRGATFPVYDPSNGNAFHEVGASTAEDVDAAVQAAKRAFKTWSKTSAEERAKYLRAIADDLEQRRTAVARLESLDNGKTFKEADLDLNDVINCFRYYADQIVKLDAKQNEPVDVGDSSFKSYVRHEPMGVAGLIVPWNYPLLMAAWKVAPCLAAGCTAVLKPSELTPLTALELAASADRVGLPAGVLNVINGYGNDAGSPLSSHPDVEKIAFTGSVATGSKVALAGATTIKKVSLELGGKSPAIVFGDADLDQVVDWATVGIFFNQGQVCSATSRLIVHHSVADALFAKLKAAAERIVVGNGLNPDNHMGPLVSKGQYEKVLGYIDSGLKEGAKILTGGPGAKVPTPGYFVAPTIFKDVEPNMRIWKEEIFGPVLSIKTFDTPEEAIELANNSTYGLAGAVFTKDRDFGEKVAREIRAGIMWVNCSQPTFVQLPWGGYKQSGTGRELGPWGLMNYLETKQVSVWVNDESKGWGWFPQANL